MRLWQAGSSRRKASNVRQDIDARRPALWLAKSRGRRRDQLPWHDQGSGAPEPRYDSGNVGLHAAGRPV